MHDRLIARQLEFDGNADRLVAAIAEQFDVPLLCHATSWHMSKTYATRLRMTSDAVPRCWAAAHFPAFALRGAGAASPRSSRRRIASERSGLSSWRAAHFAILSM